VRVLTAIALVSGLVEAVCLVIAAQFPAYVDANGFLVEPFAWMGSGRVLLLTAAACLMMAASGWTIRRVKNR